MSSVTEFLADMSPGRRITLMAGVLAIVGLTVALYVLAYRSDLQPLYTDLPAQDAAQVVAQLDELKIPHQVSADGRNILVDSTLVGETRMRIDGSNLAVQGGQGFELFDNADYGMTEFVQKINYQRALQGEIARTVMGLGVVRQARVHLVLPEQGLFQQARNEPKASVSVVQEPQRVLTAAQIAGIQQLVASAVDGMDSSGVTVIDERGVVLTQSRTQDDAAAGPSLGRKQEVEEYLSRKAASILDQLYEPGLAVVNIDVTLGTEQVQLTRETYESPEKSGKGGIATRSKTQRKFAGDGEYYANEGARQLASEVTEIDYRVDKSVEQVVRGEGAIERMTVSVMLPRAVDATVLKAIRQLVANAVGLEEGRGDSIEVSALPPESGVQSSVGDAGMDSSAPGSEAVPVVAPRTAQTPPAASFPARDRVWAGVLLLMLLVLAVALYATIRRKAAVVAPALAHGEREALLREVQRWFEEERSTDTGDRGSVSPGAG